MRRLGFAILAAVLLSAVGAPGSPARSAGRTISFDISITKPADNASATNQFLQFGSYQTSQLRIFGSFTLGDTVNALGLPTKITNLKATVVLVNSYSNAATKGTFLTLQATKAPACSLLGCFDTKSPSIGFKATVTKTDIPGCSGEWSVQLEHYPASSSSPDDVGLAGCGLSPSWSAKNLVRFSTSGAAAAPAAKPKTTPAPKATVVDYHQWTVSYQHHAASLGGIFAARAVEGSGRIGLTASGKIATVSGQLTILVIGGDFKKITAIELTPTSALYTSTGRQSQAGPTNKLVLHVKVKNLRTSNVDCIADPEGTVVLIDTGIKNRAGVPNKPDELHIESVCGAQNLTFTSAEGLTLTVG